MTPEQEYALYIAPDNQVPQGSAVRRKARLGEALPVRLPEELLQQVGERTAADDRSVTAVDPGKTLALGRLPGEASCLSLVWAVLDRASRGWRGFTMTTEGTRLLHDLRHALLDPPTQLRPSTATTPGAAATETVGAVA